MEDYSTRSRRLSPAILLGFAFIVVACGSKEPPAGAPSSAAPAAAGAPPGATAATAGPTTWTPEALEELLAPIALYPDPVLSQVLIASTNPQEVLDAGNWLLENQQLKGNALDEAAGKVGFTPPLRALVQLPDTLDMMCRELDWTTQLGQAFTADQAGVLDAVQRLRKQAESVGNLKTSPQMTVDNETQDGKEVVVLKPAANGEVYVPQYDPVAVYAPAPAVAAAPATTTTTTTTESTGHSTAALVTTGLLSFGAGLLVANLFDDDDYHHNNNYYYPNYGHGGMPYYPPYAYRPAYGNGYYPSNGYRPPAGYGGRYGNNYVNNGNVVINTGGNKNNYWNNYNGKGQNSTLPANSPITAARPNRPEMNDLNKRQARPMPADVKRPAATQASSDWKGKKTYGGAGTTASNRTAQTKAGGAGSQQRPAPKVQGSYAGGSSAGNNAARPSSGQSAYKGSSNKAGSGDRGYAQDRSQSASRPTQGAQQQPKQRPQQQAERSQQQSRPKQQSASRDSAMSGAGDRGSSDRQASQRGKQSMPQGAHSKGGGGGGGGGGGKGGKSGQGKKGR